MAAEITRELCDRGPSLPIGYGFANLECRIQDPETGAILGSAGASIVITIQN